MCPAGSADRQLSLWSTVRPPVHRRGVSVRDRWPTAVSTPTGRGSRPGRPPPAVHAIDGGHRVDHRAVRGPGHERAANPSRSAASRARSRPRVHAPLVAHGRTASARAHRPHHPVIEDSGPAEPGASRPRPGPPAARPSARRIDASTVAAQAGKGSSQRHSATVAGRPAGRPGQAKLRVQRVRVPTDGPGDSGVGGFLARGEEHSWAREMPEREGTFADAMMPAMRSAARRRRR